MNRSNPFRGMGVALVTPFTPSGEVDYPALSSLLDSHVAAGTDFLCILGTTAETPCLTAEERNAIVRHCAQRVAGRIPLLLGAGGNCTAAVVQYLREADLTGYAGVLIVAPYYNKPSQEGLFQHFAAVAEASPLPVVLYNVPGRTGVNLSAQTTLRIARHSEKVVAIKEASGRIEQIEDILAGAPEGFEVLSGDDAITFEMLTLGAAGVISVVGNAYPAAFGAMVREALAGRYDSSLRAHRKFAALYKLMTVEGNPAGIKCLLSTLHLCGGTLRLPLAPVSEVTAQRMQQAVTAFAEA